MKYQWRKMTPAEREATLADRRALRRPWHSPPHFHTEGVSRYLFTGTCLNHNPIIGQSADRMTDFENRLISAVESCCDLLVAWIVLPNHYHFMAHTGNAKTVLSELGKLHGKTSFDWNGEENQRGRQVWHNAAETAMKSERHYWASLNYVHHNAVKHNYVERWKDWTWSSSVNFLEKVGREEAEKIWKEYPVFDYGEGWDD